MPREVILQHEPRFYDESGREIPQESQPLVQISWSREAEYVQMATGERHPVTHESDTDTWRFVQLNRDMINEAIRVLRRARDQAFGRDE